MKTTEKTMPPKKTAVRRKTEEREQDRRRTKKDRLDAKSNRLKTKQDRLEEKQRRLALKQKKLEEKERRIEKRMQNKHMRVVMYVFVLMFVALAGYFAYFEVFLSQDTINNSYNSRQELLAERVVRGKILASDRTVLAQTKVDAKGNELRQYPFGSIFAHVVGYNTHGMAGLELMANFPLLTSNEPVGNRVSNDLSEIKNTGDNLITTLDVNLQKVANAALGDLRGAVIAMDYETGEIKCLVSKPDFDPNDVSRQWNNLINLSSENSVLYNRATQGLYAPGSVFKIVTLFEYIKEHPDYDTFSFVCKGSTTIEDTTINCYHKTKHGNEKLKDAFAASCNSAFATMGMDIDTKDFGETAKELLFGEKLPIDLPSSVSKFDLKKTDPSDKRMMTAIGQADTMVSPLHMLLITSAIANKGVLMKPYLMDRMENASGAIVRTWHPMKQDTLMTAEQSSVLTAFMEAVVEEGTGRNLRQLPVKVAGKTGSAEFSTDKNKTHAWFTGFTEGENRNLAVTVLVEGAGSGSEYAIPIARKVFEAYDYH